MKDKYINITNYMDMNDSIYVSYDKCIDDEFGYMYEKYIEESKYNDYVKKYYTSVDPIYDAEALRLQKLAENRNNKIDQIFS